MIDYSWLLVIIAYCIGSICSAIVVCRVMGLPDPREQGSGNPGATNVMRFGGKKAAAITLLGDLFKGLLPVLVGQFLGLPSVFVAGLGAAAFLGHLYPIFFGFKGGKGVATSVGVLLGFSWQLGILVIATWLLVYKLSKISSLSALIASVLSSGFAWWLGMSEAIIYASLMMTVFLLWRHQANIKRLLAGQEK
jgi:glycerol-3-phosphate acyltransferase PlsY